VSMSNLHACMKHPMHTGLHAAPLPHTPSPTSQNTPVTRISRTPSPFSECTPHHHNTLLSSSTYVPNFYHTHQCPHPPPLQPAPDPRLDPSMDPKKARRILANRLSAAKSKMKQKSQAEVRKKDQHACS
jgi:hypothetical protein